MPSFVSYLLQVPDQPGHYIQYSPSSPRQAEIVASPLMASMFWTRNDALMMVGYGDFFLHKSQLLAGESCRIVENRGAHVLRLTLTLTHGLGTHVGQWELEDLGP